LSTNKSEDNLFQNERILFCFFFQCACAKLTELRQLPALNPPHSRLWRRGWAGRLTHNEWKRGAETIMSFCDVSMLSRCHGNEHLLQQL